MMERIPRTDRLCMLEVRPSPQAGFGDDSPVPDYELIDAGDGARLERFGEHVTDRPHPGATGDRSIPDRWREADLRYERDVGWTGRGVVGAASGWQVAFNGLDLGLRTTDAGQVGLFPEHGALLPWLEARVRERAADGAEPEVLNLFAYTGLVTLALARIGARVTHVDAARPSVAWARQNAQRNGLDDRPVRWLVDDARAFTAREVRRGRRYDGLVLDPPSYGHGAGGRWQIERDLGPLLAACRGALRPDGFVVLTAHTPAYDPDRLASELRVLDGDGDRADADDLTIPAADGRRLVLGAFARWDGA
jgi:23S rRNA (cytosine1962-C5)-methyltransferase